VLGLELPDEQGRQLGLAVLEVCLACQDSGDIGRGLSNTPADDDVREALRLRRGRPLVEVAVADEAKAARRALEGDSVRSPAAGVHHEGRRRGNGIRIGERQEVREVRVRRCEVERDRPGRLVDLDAAREIAAALRANRGERRP
jgi:hypothetical protein